MNETEFCIITDQTEDNVDYQQIHDILNKMYIFMIFFSILYFYMSLIYECINCNENKDELIKITQQNKENSNNYLLMRKSIENIYDKICKIQIKIEKLNKKQKQNYKKIRNKFNKLKPLQEDND